jgi:hypothetical protein
MAEVGKHTVPTADKCIYVCISLIMLALPITWMPQLRRRPSIKIHTPKYDLDGTKL